MRRLFQLTIIGVGISSINSQILLLRELVSLFDGNELVISLCLFTWLILGGIGSLIPRWIRPKVHLYLLLCVLAGLLPLALIIASRFAFNTLFPLGFSPGFYSVLYFALLIIGPYSLLIGLLLPYSLDILRSMDPYIATGKIYLFDNLGDILGGLFSTALFLIGLKIFNAILLCSLLTVFSCLAISFHSNRKLFWTLLSLFTIFLVLTTNNRLHTFSLSFQYKNIVDYIESPYSRYVITREGEQYTLWESGSPTFYSQDIVKAEEKVHYALSQLKDVSSVLFISGLTSLEIHEAQKHNPEIIYYVELDPTMVQLKIKYSILTKIPNLKLIHTDARSFIDNTELRFDAIITDLSLPDTLQLNRLYTLNAISNIKRMLSNNGVFSFSIDYNQNYLNEQQRRIIASLLMMLRTQFSHVILIPGERLHVISSNSSLSFNIPRLLEEKGISTSYISGYYDGNVTPERLANLMAQLPGEGLPNTDTNIFLLRLTLKEWLERYSASPSVVFGVIGLFFILYFLFIRKHEYMIFTTGLSFMGVEALVLYLFQITFGYLYLAVSGIITVFLLGLLPGAFLGMKIKGSRWLWITELMILCLICLVTFSMYSANYKVHWVFYLIFGFFFSLVAGFQFPLLARELERELGRRTPYGLFSADLCGAALGIIIIGVLVTLTMGLIQAGILLILIKLSSVVLGLWTLPWKSAGAAS